MCSSFENHFWRFIENTAFLVKVFGKKLMILAGVGLYLFDIWGDGALLYTLFVYRGLGFRNSLLGSRLQKHTSPARAATKDARKNARRGSVF